MERRVLGKGLEALIPKKEQPLQLRKEYIYIDIKKLKPGPYQSRTDVKEPELKELAESIKTQGIIQPLIVRKRQDYYEIIAGSRRYYASKSLGIKELPVIIRELEDKDALVFSIIENLQRQDLNPMEEARSFKRLVEEFLFSEEEVGRMLAKDKTTIVNALRLFKLPEVIQEALRDGRIRASSARTILGLQTEKEQLALFEQLLKEKISVRRLEETVRSAKAKKKPLDPYVRQMENKLQKTLARKVKIISQGKKGKLVIEYYSHQDLENLIQFLQKASR